MADRVTLGNFFNSGGRRVVTGSNTGFDTETLINGLVEARRIPAVRLEDKIEANSKKTAAYNDLANLLNAFEDSANFLRNPPGVNNQSENIFEYRTTSLSTNSGVSADNYLEASIEPGASLSSYDITIGSLATYNIKTTNTFALAGLNTAVVGATDPFQAGTINIGASGTAVTLANGDTLQNVIDKINAVSTTTKVQATAIQVSSGNYRLQLKTTETGANLNYATPSLAVFATGFAVDISATNASVTIDGTTISSQSNTVDDAIDGISLTLKQQTPMGTTVSMEVEADVELVKDAILNFVDSFNNLKLFNARQTEIGEDGLPLETSVLNNSSALRNIVSSIVNEVSALVDGLTSPNALADIGITLTDYEGDEENPFTRNTLVVDEEKLRNALNSDFDSVRKIFEFDYTSNNSEVQVFKRTNALDVNSFSLNINLGTSTYEATYGATTVTLTGTAISGGGLLLEGPEGSALEGLQLLYSGSVDTTATIDLTQGIGDRTFNLLNDFINPVEGTIAVELESLVDSETRMEAEILRIDNFIAVYRQQLLEKFSALESALGRINSILASLDANAAARNNA